ncbi:MULTISPECIES: hypothetical protein [Actinomycetes]|uniref:Uncharacterized protein n=1 Tax=Streptomyces gilvosporeus TaxID=553510 RepID=A0A1V0TT98_9ACTN|nr:hypothetical protein [Streptomyces gilvosporeus]ARF55988.1 hypothetical protein B1H19_18955 [Streptomyces gilvosporeus]
MPTAETARREAVAALRTVRELWGDLLLAIETPRPDDVWPPRQLSHLLRPVADEVLDVVERAPLVLREHPAPLNLDALDAGLAVERQLFDLADTLAAAVQRAPLDDPRRWTFRSPTDPGSRAHGLHWAAVWIEGRVLDEDTTPEHYAGVPFDAAPFAPLPEYLLHEAWTTARVCADRVLRALDLDHRSTLVPGRPCPWCAGQLTLHTGPDEPPTVTCSTGPACSAPVLLNMRGRRVWGWRELPALVVALDAAQERQCAPAA